MLPEEMEQGGDFNCANVEQSVPKASAYRMHCACRCCASGSGNVVGAQAAMNARNTNTSCGVCCSKVTTCKLRALLRTKDTSLDASGFQPFPNDSLHSHSLCMHSLLAFFASYSHHTSIQVSSAPWIWLALRDPLPN